MLPVTKATMLSLLFVLCSQLIFASNPDPRPAAAAPSVRRWDARITSQGSRLKGLLYSVSDSSLTLLQKGARYQEIPFKQIDRIRLRKRSKWEGPALAGWIAGGAAGMIIGGVATKKKDTGDEFEDDTNYTSRLILNIFAGLFLGAIIGGGLGWLFTTLFGGKKFNVQHDTGSYADLKAKLERFTMR